MGFFFLKVEYELCSPRSYPIIVGRYRKLAAQITYGILIKGNRQFKNDGTTPFFIGQIPDAFTQNGIDYRPYFILSAPDGIKVSHNTQSSIPR